MDAQISLPAQGVTALFGPSGCGKTTLLRCLAGLLRAEQGRLSVGGQVWQDERYFLPPHRRPIGYVFQEASLLPHLSVEQNLRFGLNRSSSRDKSVIGYRQAVDLLGLTALLPRTPDKLSGGERQRVAIGRALLSQPQLLLMDEPLSALDQAGKREILPFLDNLSETLCLPTLYVSHSLNEVSRLASHMIYLDAGVVKDQGRIAEVAARLPVAPMAGEEAGILEGRVMGHAPEYGLSYLDIAGQKLSVSLRKAGVGKRVRVSIPARDLALCLEPPRHSSMLNTLPVTVTGFRQLAAPGRILVELRCGESHLLAKITRKSQELLRLCTGMQLYAQIKTVSLQDEWNS